MAESPSMKRQEANSSGTPLDYERPHITTCLLQIHRRMDSIELAIPKVEAELTFFRFDFKGEGLVETVTFEIEEIFFRYSLSLW
jgi:hypothetical protein